MPFNLTLELGFPGQGAQQVVVRPARSTQFGRFLWDGALVVNGTPADLGDFGIDAVGGYHDVAGPIGGEEATVEFDGAIYLQDVASVLTTEAAVDLFTESGVHLLIES